MTDDIATTTPAFWDRVAEHVGAQVTPALKLSQSGRASVVAYLRDLECIARRECDSRQAIQIIASGRRLLGDFAEIIPSDGPFSRT